MTLRIKEQDHQERQLSSLLMSTSFVRSFQTFFDLFDIHIPLTSLYSATVEFTEEILPYLTEDAKIIEVSSTFGQLTYQPEAARAILSD